MTIMNGSESKFKRFLNTERYFYTNSSNLPE